MATLLKNILSFYEKNLHGRILKKELKEQHLHTVLKFYPYIYRKISKFWGAIHGSACSHTTWLLI